jgi:hypothetical protein
MHHTAKPGPFPWLSIFAGIIGFSLQSWLFSSADTNGLLPASHIAQILSFLLFAITLASCFLLLKKSQQHTHYEAQFPRSVIAGIGSFVGALALGYSALSQGSFGALRLILPVFGIVSACALLFRGYCRIVGLRPHFLISCVVIAYLVLWSVLCCRNWCSQPQLQHYVFQAFATVFLLLASYYRAELELGTDNCRRYTFFCQVALFCCCLCIPGENSLFYLLAAIWMAADSCTLRW